MIFPSRVVDLDNARRQYGADADRLASWLTKCDPLADACVEAFAKMPPREGNAMLDRALAHGIDSVVGAPPALTQLFEQVDRVPEWVDWGELDTAGELLLRTGPLGAMVLAFRSLVLAYAAPGGNKPLVLSGRLTEQAARRLIETGHFTHAVCSHAGLRRYAEGFRHTIKVRMMHAQVRRLVRRSGKWRRDAWGEPINQHDMLATILLFSVSLLDGLSTLGFAIEEEEARKYYALWRYAGLLIGVDAEVMPATLAQARRYGDVICAIQGPPDDDSRALVDALFGPGLGQPRNLRDERFLHHYRRFARALGRALVGDELADAVGLPRDLAYAPRVVRAIVKNLERVRTRSTFMQRIFVIGGDMRWKHVVADGLAGEAAEFKMPEAIRAESRDGLRDPSKGAGASPSP